VRDEVLSSSHLENKSEINMKILNTKQIQNVTGGCSEGLINNLFKSPFQSPPIICLPMLEVI
jgi:hypothetical protein